MTAGGKPPRQRGSFEANLPLSLSLPAKTAQERATQQDSGMHLPNAAQYLIYIASLAGKLWSLDSERCIQGRKQGDSHVRD